MADDSLETKLNEKGICRYIANTVNDKGEIVNDVYACICREWCNHQTRPYVKPEKPLKTKWGDEPISYDLIPKCGYYSRKDAADKTAKQDSEEE